MEVNKLITSITKCFLAGSDFKINTDPEESWCAFIQCKEDQVLHITRIIHRILNSSGIQINMDEVQDVVRKEVYKR